MLSAGFALLLLAGCSSDHIGESWQCPLAAGGSCVSVAAADPTVPDPKAARNTVLAEPLWRARATEPETPPEPPCAAECQGGFDPFAWLAGLFGAETHEGEARPSGEPAQAPAATAAPPSVPGPGEEADAPAAPAATALPAEPETAEQDPAADDWRTGEVIGRIWIAPFVDADGVYREASHVRVVLEPARWRLR